MTGLEPVTYRLGGGRSIHLSYTGICKTVYPFSLYCLINVTTAHRLLGIATSRVKYIHPRPHQQKNFTLQNGDSSGTRTPDLHIKSVLLYQLS